MSEHDEQVALFDWVKLYAREEPRLRTMFAIPNQGVRVRVLLLEVRRWCVRA